ncbi:TNF receptor-associated factor 4-like [Dysidea avara]|uniref:TNF receptor-associated factor 4-like n=1 Tax=Dysidea avara TaxID=196820 RepID=UPI003330B0E2
MAIAPPTKEGTDITLPSPDWLMCKLCHHPSRETCLSKCCGNTFCKRCAVDVLEDNDTCPICRNKKNVTNDHKQVLAEQVAGILHVTCTNKEKGCPWKGKVNDISGHLRNSDGCLFEEVTCPNDCGTSIQRQHFISHVEHKCVHRIVECQYCHFTGEHQFIHGEHEVLCPKFLVPCPKKSQKTDRDSEKDSQTKRIDELEGILTQQMRVLEMFMGKETIQHFINIHNTARKMSSGEEVVPVIVKMSDYTTNKRDRVNWYSDPFYTHPNGHKMCLYCYAGTTHLSVHLYLMKSPHDDRLRWPLKGYCEMKLLNQVSDSEHYTGTGNYDTNSHIRVTSAERLSMWYSNQFITNKHLLKVTSTCQYLKDDSIFLQVDYKPLQ